MKKYPKSWWQYVADRKTCRPVRKYMQEHGIPVYMVHIYGGYHEIRYYANEWQASDFVKNLNIIIST